MNKFVENDDVILGHQRGDGAERRRVAGRKGQRGFGAFEGGEGFLEFMKRRERTADEPGRARARAKLFDGFDRGFLQSGMIGETEIIVRGEIEKGLAGDFNAR